MIKAIVPPQERERLMTTREIVAHVSETEQHGALRELLIEDVKINGYSPERMERDFADLFPFPSKVQACTRQAIIAAVVKGIMPENERHHLKNAVDIRDEVLTRSTYKDVREAIVTMVERDCLSAEQVMVKLGDRIPWPADCAEATRQSLVLSLIRNLVRDGHRKKARKTQHLRTMEKQGAHMIAQSRKAMLQRGYKVFTDDEREMFLKILQRKGVRNGDRYDHELVAKAMNDHFQVDGFFTAEFCRRQLDILRRAKARKTRKKQRPVADDTAPEPMIEAGADPATLAVDIEQRELDAVRRALGLPTTQDKPLAVSEEFKVAKGETLHAAAARVIAGKVAVLDAGGDFGSIADLVLSQRYWQALSALQSLAEAKPPETWKPIVQQLYALTLLCVDAASHVRDAGRLFEFASRTLAESDSGFVDGMALPHAVSGAILQGGEERVRGRYSSSRPSAKCPGEKEAS